MSDRKTPPQNHSGDLSDLSLIEINYFFPLTKSWPPRGVCFSRAPPFVKRRESHVQPASHSPPFMTQSSHSEIAHRQPLAEDFRDGRERGLAGVSLLWRRWPLEVRTRRAISRLPRSKADSTRRDSQSGSSGPRPGPTLSEWSKNTMEYGAAAGAPSFTSHPVWRNSGRASTRNTKRDSFEQTAPTPRSSTTGRALSGGVSSDILRSFLPEW